MRALLFAIFSPPFLTLQEENFHAENFDLSSLVVYHSMEPIPRKFLSAQSGCHMEFLHFLQKCAA